MKARLLLYSKGTVHIARDVLLDKRATRGIHGFSESKMLMIQGLNWYTSRLKQDGDGDVADEFLEEPSAIATNDIQQTKVIGSSPSLQV